MSLHTIVTFEGSQHFQGGYAVVQRGTARMIVSRERGQRILDGIETITFNSDRLVPRTHRGKGRRKLPKRTTVEVLRVGMGLQPDDQRLQMCTKCHGNAGTQCSRCKGLGFTFDK